jgi:hypothetical protein
MEPNKFEKHIKNQLEEREINPSTKAWNKLTEKLDSEKSMKRKPNYFRYAIAASFIGFLVIAIIFFTRTNEIAPPIQVVETPDQTIDMNLEVPETKLETGLDKVVQTEEVSKKEVIENKVFLKVIDSDKTIVSLDEANHLSDEIILPLKASEAIINTKILEVVAQVDMLEEQNESLTDAEVDSLLRKAQSEIMNDNFFRKDRSVDAMALLTEVEDELDKSFRDQIFESLKSGFMKVRTAVADRNN